MTNPIVDALPYHTDEEPTGTQDAWHAVIHLVIPHTDINGNPVDTEADASDYVSETLRGQFLDWGYVVAPTADPDDSEETALQTPIRIVVSDPYIEGTFLEES